METKRTKKIRRQKRVRAKIRGNSARPRFSVFRSNRHLWVQFIDDNSGRTLISASDLELTRAPKTKTGSADANLKTKKSSVLAKSKTRAGRLKKMDLASALGELAARKAKEAGIQETIFDRGAYKYHGLIKSLAEGARKGGLKF